MGASSSSHLSVTDSNVCPNKKTSIVPGCVQEPVTLGSPGTLCYQPNTVPLLSGAWGCDGWSGEGKRRGRERKHKDSSAQSIQFDTWGPEM